MLVIADASGAVVAFHEPPDGMEWWPEDGTDDYVRVVEANLPAGVSFAEAQVVRTPDRSLTKYHLSVSGGAIVVGDEKTPPPDTSPDVDGMLLAAFEEPVDGGLGEDRAIALVQARPDLQIALERSNWKVARKAVDRALDRSVISQDEYDMIQTLFDTYHIPEGSA